MAKTPAHTTELVPVITPTLTTIRGHGWASSLQVAEHFGKSHKNVLQSIRNLECSPEFTELNFQLSEFTDSTGRTLPCYMMTRDGFAMLAFGFTGKAAAVWREAFLKAFKQLEQAYLEQLEQKAEAALQVRQTREMLLTVPWSEQLKHRYEGLRLLDLVKAEPDRHRRQHHYVSLQRFNALQGEDTPPLEELAPSALMLENGPSRAELLEKVEDLERLRDLLVNALRGLTSMAMDRLVFEGSEELPGPLNSAVKAIKIANHQKGGVA